jgi:hypothetical protein
MDTQLNQPVSHNGVAGSDSHLRAFASEQSATSAAEHCGRYSADTLRTVRIGVAEYARAGGMRDPDNVSSFTRLCIGEAAARLAARRSDNASDLLDEALKVAATRCGVDPKATASPSSSGDGSEHSSGAMTAKHRALTAVPKSRPRAMPPQPLGELPDVTPAGMWNSMLRLAWQPVWILATKIYEMVTVQGK